MARSDVQMAPQLLTLRWSPPQPVLRNGVITQYTVEVNRTSTGESQTFNPTNTMVTVESLHPHTMYSYRIAARTSAGQGPFTDIRYITTLEDGKSIMQVELPPLTSS